MTDWLVFAALHSTQSGFNWIAVGEVMTAAAAIGTLLWAVKRDRKRDQRGVSEHSDEMTSNYLKRSLDAFDELVRSLQSEVERLTSQRDAADKTSRNREIALIREIARLRAEIQLLREELRKNGIMVPDFATWYRSLGEDLPVMREQPRGG